MNINWLLISKLLIISIMNFTVFNYSLDNNLMLEDFWSWGGDPSLVFWPW